MKPTVAHVLELLDKRVNTLGLNNWQLTTLKALKNCRTAAMGGHIDSCDACGKLSISYNSCRNRHCPQCQGHKREQWMAARMGELLPVAYFHVVFTLPNELNQACLYTPKVLYNSLFTAAWQTLAAFGNDKDLKMGMIALLHTWGQNLSLHPHLHCIVPGGGVNSHGRWQNLRANDKFLFSVKAMSKVFRAKFMAQLKGKIDLDKPVRDTLFQKEWVVYAKRPFGNAAGVLEYLGRYSHKVAISNQRIQSISSQEVSFSYKDYKTQGQKKQLRLTLEEFTRRFAQHILPKRFCKIRHCGFLSSTWKREKLKLLQGKLKAKKYEPKPSKLGRCRCCKEGNLVSIHVFGSRGPPPQWQYLLETNRPQA
jgi:hypothetical protein